MKAKNRTALVVLVTGASCFFASAANAGEPVQVFGLHGAYIDNAMLSSSVANASDEAEPSIVLPSMVGGSNAFRYSGAFNSTYSWGTNSLKIAMTRGQIANPANHVVAWQGVNGSSTCGSLVAACNWMQGGVALGLGCFNTGSATSQWLYFELNYNGTGSSGCPAQNFNGYLIWNIGIVASGSQHTIIMYVCQSTSGCTYTQSSSCGTITWSSSYLRGTARIDGCIRASNVYLDGPDGPQPGGTREYQGVVEDFYGNAHGDAITGQFRQSTNVYPNFKNVGGFTCGGFTTNDQMNWDGCLNAN